MRSARWLAIALFLPARVFAWGAQGHEIVGAIADERLSPAARAMVRELVGDIPLSDSAIATWADGLRDRRLKPLHYVNIPFGAGRYSPPRDCPSGACVVAEIQRATEQLAGHGSPLERADALRWIVHVVGDVHQPLHCGDAWDRGGNGFTVRVGRRRQPTNFHRVWDSDVVRPLVHKRDVLGAAQSLAAGISRRDEAAWAADLNPGTWAEESSREARAMYAELGHRPQDTGIVALPGGYPKAESTRAAVYLRRAGVRLAALLNQIATRRSR